MRERRRRPPEEQAELSYGRKSIPEFPPARSEEEEEKRAIGLAMDVAIEQMRTGKASSQIITHFLKLGSLKEQAELEKTRKEIELLEAKRKAVEAAEDQDKKYQEVIKAIASYSGKDDGWEVVDDTYDGVY